MWYLRKDTHNTHKHMCTHSQLSPPQTQKTNLQIASSVYLLS